jgi:hypothetical protein
VAHRAGHQLHRERPDLVAGVIRQVAAEASP